jgi:hypothetical protein
VNSGYCSGATEQFMAESLDIGGSNADSTPKTTTRMVLLSMILSKGDARPEIEGSLRE